MRTHAHVQFCGGAAAAQGELRCAAVHAHLLCTTILYEGEEPHIRILAVQK